MEMKINIESKTGLKCYGVIFQKILDQRGLKLHIHIWLQIIPFLPIHIYWDKVAFDNVTDRWLKEIDKNAN